MRLLPRNRIVWNGDIKSVEDGSPVEEGDTILSEWRFTWAGVKNQNIAIEKEQVRMKAGNLYLEHWDHVMTYPEECKRSMEIVDVHLHQHYAYQTDLEERLAAVDDELETLKEENTKNKHATAMEKERKVKITDKMKGVVDQMKCGFAKTSLESEQVN